MESSIVVKAFQLLEAVVAEPGSSLTELASMLGMSKPTAHRVLGELRSLGYLQKDPRGTYMTAPAIWRLMPGVHGHLLAAAAPVMRKLWRRTHETVNLGVLRGQQIQYLQVWNSDLPLRREVNVGELDPALTTAMGRMIISRLPVEDQSSFLESLPKKRTPHTLTTKKDLREVLALTVGRGFAIDDQETDLGVICVAVPIPLNHGEDAALSISLPNARLETRGGIDSLARLAKRAAGAISRRLNSREEFPGRNMKS